MCKTNWESSLLMPTSFHKREPLDFITMEDLKKDEWANYCCWLGELQQNLPSQRVKLHKGNKNITNPALYNKKTCNVFWKACALKKDKSGRQWKLKFQKAQRTEDKAGGQLQKGRMTQPEDVDLFLLLGPSFIKIHQNPTPGPSKTVSGLKKPQYGQYMHFKPDKQYMK